MILLFKSFVLGLSVAAPVGPIGVLSIRRTLAEGRAVGLATGLGAAAADALYGLAAGLGVGAASSLLELEAPMRFVGAIWLLVMGLGTWRKPPSDHAASTKSASGLFGAFLSTFALTVSNPMTMLSFAAMLSAIGVGASDAKEVALVVIGVLLGSASWWLFLSFTVDRARTLVTPRRLVFVNRSSGAILIAFALLSLVG
jgi:threonine/homoserine/homoserine lactone efflux protein